MDAKQFLNELLKDIENNEKTFLNSNDIIATNECLKLNDEEVTKLIFNVLETLYKKGNQKALDKIILMKKNGYQKANKILQKILTELETKIKEMAKQQKTLKQEELVKTFTDLLMKF